MEPDFAFEDAARHQGFCSIAGIDEVGRGPICGPVTAAAAIFFAPPPEGLRDSKRLSAKRRGEMALKIKQTAHCAYAHASVEEIDHLNILQATFLAMRRAVSLLPVKPDFALIDGNKVPPDLCVPAQAVVKGDTKSLSIAAASVIAKVARDELMQQLGLKSPQYLWHQNAGYPTKAHLEALKEHGVTPHHRVSFRPVHNMLWQNK